MKKYDCIFIPGGGLLPDGSLPAWTQARVHRAVALQDQTHWIALLSGGTVHKPPPLTDAGQPVFESRAAAIYLLQKGLSPEQILTEICSYDTIGNAYFSRLLFAEPLQLKKILVISSEFHLARVQEAFEWIYYLTPCSINYQLSFESVPNEDLSQEVLKARKEREERSIKNLKQLRNRIKTMGDYTHWLYTEHNAYAPGSQKEELSDTQLGSY